MAEESGWCTIESDPGVFTELLSAIGVKDVQVEELYTLDKSELSSHGRVYGLVFLFKYDRNLASARPLAGRLIDPPPEALFFANQTIQNACATQAILSIVMNAPGLSVGAELERFREFAAGMDSMTKGMVVGNSEIIRTAHNSFAPQQQFVLEDSPAAEKEDPFHFVAYIPHDGKVYELDGLQRGPIELGDAGEGDSWLDVAAPVITRRMEEYNQMDASEIRFNLMKVVEDPRERLQAELATLRKNASDNAGRIGEVQTELMRLEEQHKQWHLENVRRRHNFVPFMISFLKTLATSGHMDAIIQSITEKKRTALREQEAKAGGAEK